jgi:hypothetical protein
MRKEHRFQFADLHCHPNLKTYGHSFKKGRPNKKQDLWFSEKPTTWRKILKVLTGITRFSQADFQTMAKGGSKIAVVSLYPFEKGFFINAAGGGAFSAMLADWITGISFERIRYLQEHTDYFEDLQREYAFFLNGRKEHVIGSESYSWRPTSNWKEVETILETPNQIAVVLSIEGAHVFNTGLGDFGRDFDEAEVLENVRIVKKWDYPPLFITFAHNFNNDLCGHASSLDPLKPFVNQRKNLGEGFMPVAEKVLDALLDQQLGRRILIDLKHMSLAARIAYYSYLQTHDQYHQIPLIVSHGAAAGVQLNGTASLAYNEPLFSASDINFFDEEILNIGRSNGLFAIQFDSRRIAGRRMIASVSKNIYSRSLTRQSAQIVWNQIRHIAELLDKDGRFAWGTACIGSDFDGTINPLNGILTVEDFPLMAKELLSLADQYLRSQPRMGLAENRKITPEEIVERFCIRNTMDFLEKHY